MFQLVLIHQNDEKVYHILKAWKELEKTGAALSVYDAWQLDSDESLRAECQERLAEADFVLLLLHGGLTWFRGYDGVKVCLEKKKAYFYYSGVEEEISQVMGGSLLLPEQYRSIYAYYELGGSENFQNMFLYLFRELAGQPVCEKPAAAVCREGIWGAAEADEEAVLEEAEKTGLPVIGILVHYLNAMNGDTAHITALEEAVREKGGWPLAVVSTMQPTGQTAGVSGVIERYFKKGQKARIHGLIVTTGFSMTMLAEPGEGRKSSGASIFTGLGVPVFQAVSTYMTREKWEESSQGIDSMSLGSSIYEPEMDGQIITTVIGCTEHIETESGRVSRLVPLPDQIRFAAGLAVRWGRLRRKDPKEKRVAILLHNMPPRNDMLGCAYGLDTPESVFRMVEVLEEEGLAVERPFRSGREIMDRLTRGLTNDFGYLSKQQIRERSAAVLPGGDYQRWFGKQPEKVKSEMERVWGEAPGSFFVLDSDVLIPGILNGNLFIGIQPPREGEERAEEAYHSLKTPCPHSYLGYYQWLREEFGADLIYHVGAHGTVEWLPGKAVGLSRACYPALAMDEIPHAYPYIMNLAGEGSQAKRRADAVMISHMVPPMQKSGLYGKMEELSEKLEQYENAKSFDPGQSEALAEDIRHLAGELKMDDGLAPDLAGWPGILHSRLEEIRSSQIRDGLHVLGKIPEGMQLEHMLDFLALGGGERSALKELVEQIPRELAAVRKAFRGEFIEPGASGCPSLGAYEALPTGRNFYGVHPQKIPTRAAWRSGQELARKLLEKSREDLGQMPEAITMVVYSGETMKTNGDTIAEILALYGIRPCWLKGTDRVIGLERIPLSQLGRPRIDVTLRASGLFRDNFPNLIELLEEAVHLAGAAEEREADNFVRSHMIRDVRKYVAEGIAHTEAVRRASARIFSCPPGQYGAGVGALVESGKWEERKDLGEAYLAWSGFAYGKEIRGEAWQGALADRLKDSQILVKNLPSVEEDLLDSDDFYNYYGGAIAAAESVKGGPVLSYAVSTADGREEKIRPVQEEMERLVRARLMNPSWIEGLRRHGYRGAQEMSAAFDVLFGWDASTGLVSDWVYEGMVDTYLRDPELRRWIKEQNPWAIHQMSERLLEAQGRGMWKAKPESLRLTQKVYLEMEGNLERTM